MTHHTDLPPLQVDDDGLARVRELVGCAVVDRRLWLMFFDGDGRQSPVLMPVDDMPAAPEPALTRGLGQVLGGIRDDLTTRRAGSVILTMERLGPDEVLASDLAWAVALRDTCQDAGVDVRGLFLSTPTAVQRI
ncbi:MAG: hypothetical protein L0H84_21155 [Pseudonocardia sp.]|nr:hypothetical protein [Pseudonocardia sp.]